MTEVLKAYDLAGQKKCGLSVGKMLILGLFAGAFIALGGLGSQFAGTIVNKFAGAFVFPVGLMMVVLTGAELFTGNCLLIMPVVRRAVSVPRMLLSWLIVYIGNALGGLLIACAVYGAGVLPEEARAAAVSAYQTKCALSAPELLIRGILCNVLVCIAVYLAFAAKDVPGKILSLFFPTMLFVLCSFEHSIANWYFLPLGSLYAGSGVLNGSMAANLCLVTLGNILGGAGIVGLGFAYAGKTSVKRDK